MKLIEWLRDKLHIHKYYKPIVSQYISFHSRNIIYECKCGKREVSYVYRDFDEPFPIETATNISNKEFMDVLEGKNYVQS